LLASVQITSYNSHSASFGPSAVRVNTETVYSGGCEAGLVMTLTGNHQSFSGRVARLNPESLVGHPEVVQIIQTSNYGLGGAFSPEALVFIKLEM